MKAGKQFNGQQYHLTNLNLKRRLTFEEEEKDRDERGLRRASIEQPLTKTITKS